MSLTITSTIKTNEGFEITNAYGRVAVVDAFTGTSIEEYCNLYLSEAEYLNGAQPLNVPYDLKLTSAYDRTVLTTDILDLAHDHLIAELAKEGVVAIKNL